jgi:hypothetical protein
MLSVSGEIPCSPVSLEMDNHLQDKQDKREQKSLSIEDVPLEFPNRHSHEEWRDWIVREVMSGKVSDHHELKLKKNDPIWGIQWIGLSLQIQMCPLQFCHARHLIFARPSCWCCLSVASCSFFHRGWIRVRGKSFVGERCAMQWKGWHVVLLIASSKSFALGWAFPWSTVWRPLSQGRGPFGHGREWSGDG